ncbi:MAG: DUF1178 family protein [Rhodobacteraceae bacterium]|nr:DUF1178 family protein [Paracoccaceae bacterium]
MISFTLGCEAGHDFEGWFGSSSDFEKQKSRKLVECPTCGSTKVEKTLMAPVVSTSKASDKVNVANVDNVQRKMLSELKEIRERITANAEDVGERFPEEARKIHYGEAETRGIYGAASLEDVKELVDEGVEIAPLPVLPDDAN